MATAAEHDPHVEEQHLEPWPAYFFPPLSQQRRVFCLEVLKREDIPSVCELGCGEGSVLSPMTNPASHSDTFPDMAQHYHYELEDPETDPDEDPGATHVEPRSMAKGAERQGNNGDDESMHGEGSESPADAGEEASIGHTTPRRPTINFEIVEKLKTEVPKLRVQDKELHLRRIAGVDIVPEHLQQAIEATSPPPSDAAGPNSERSPFSYERDRWEDLRVDIWQGSLEVFNESLDSFDSFIMTEVIEHLSDRTLTKFPETLFGTYRPRIIVVTTPNYDFNQYFEKGRNRRRKGKGKQLDDEADEDETKHEIRDPTGRTDRLFRDDDHKFEWTQAEFAAWCEGITSKYEYTVEISGVGSLQNYFGKGGFHTAEDDDDHMSDDDRSQAKPGPPQHIRDLLASCPGGDPTEFFATQTAVFRRRFAYESERSPRSPVQVPLAFYNRSSLTSLDTAGKGTMRLPSERSPKGDMPGAPSHTSGVSTDISPSHQHKLLKSHYYKSVHQAGDPKSLRSIRTALDEMMRERMRLRRCSLRELWGRTEISRACGGYINKIIEAVIRDPMLSWDLEFDSTVLPFGSQLEDAVYLVLKNFVQPPFVWTDPEEEEAAKKEKKLKWYERDLELEDDIRGMRIDEKDAQEGGADVEQEAGHEWGYETGSTFGQDETWKAWDSDPEQADREDAISRSLETAGLVCSPEGGETASAWSLPEDNEDRGKNGNPEGLTGWE